jgi:hypothetical protein
VSKRQDVVGTRSSWTEHLDLKDVVGAGGG